MADGTMTRTECEAFLAGVHVRVLAVDEPGRGPHALPIWYQYSDGELRMRVADDSRKAALLRDAGRATLTVQSEEVPYKYVSVEGPVHVLAHGGGYDELAVATHYLGPELGPWYVENAGAEESTIVILTPEHWRSFDFAKIF
jgi:nitroimidazol reductase NimA-like FMN-containing flavoprotein (pyridoxamine 5'-phosphate oxidase superfamily)